MARGADIVFLCVTGSPQIESIVYGPEGLLSSARNGQIVVDSSTAEPSSTERMRADFARRGTRYVDAPLARTPQDAEEGKLNCMVGAEPADFAAIKPVLEKFCENIFHVGPPGAGHKIKLVYNFVAMEAAAIPRRSPSRQERLSLEKLFPAGLGRRRQLQHVPDDGPQGAQGRPQRPDVHARQREERTSVTTRQSRAGAQLMGEAAHQSWCRRTRSASARSSSRPDRGLRADVKVRIVRGLAACQRRSTASRHLNEPEAAERIGEKDVTHGKRRKLLKQMLPARLGGRVLRPVEGATTPGRRRAEEAAGDRPHHGRERPVRRERHGRAPRRDARDPRVQRQGRRARPPDRGAAHGHRDHAGHRLARRRAHDHAQRGRVPDRRGAFGRGQRHLAGGAEVRHGVLQHQLELAHRGRPRLPPRQVRLGRQRHQLQPRHRQERDAGERPQLAAAHQRLRLGP